MYLEKVGMSNMWWVDTDNRWCFVIIVTNATDSFLYGLDINLWCIWFYYFVWYHRQSVVLIHNMIILFINFGWKIHADSFGRGFKIYELAGKQCVLDIGHHNLLLA